ncbi:MAG: cytochrome C [Oryzomonas sp.]|uniref:cytochrome C n=1 Tax=Oryzomonas sp. TaxID=2855186 RepID=UPI00284BA858|nr:cytochrome C [Oryzomonas sp.]MDR3579735.1 cytochrome C [Oryzomonas sp.]
MWDEATECGFCHPGGGFVEKDRNGKRYSQMSPTTDGMTPFNATVFELYSTTTGLPKHKVIVSPWSYPLYQNGAPVITPGGWGQTATMQLPDGSPMPVFAGQVMMPNVKEFDCLACHFEGYSNLMSSVMSMSGGLNAGPSFGAGFMNMFTQAYDFTTGMLQKDSSGNVSLTPAFFTKMTAQPSSQNCRNCHMPSGLKDLPDMMNDFLSGAPMAYTGSFTQSFTGLAMPAFDFNAPFGYTWDWTVQGSTSPTLYMTQTGIGSTTSFTTTIPSGWPSALGMTPFNAAALSNFSSAMPAGYKQYFLGGGNPAGSGPIYFQATIPGSGGMQDQNALKKGILPFPRAEWFKRGDLWAADADVHYSLECSGCHMNTNTTKVDVFAAPTSASNSKTVFNGKSLCDPGRGFDWLSGTEGNAALRTKVNSQNTVKKCENCHLTGQNSDGVAINTYGAPNPTAKHQQYGLLRNVTNKVIATSAAVFTAAGDANPNGSQTLARGNHLDVVDCTVCHLYRKQMAVRMLDSSSGARFPNMIGFDASRGMLGMFSNPMPGTIPANTNLQEWKPAYIWQKYGNYWKTNDDGTVNSNWNRKIYPVNFITASLWNNVDPTVDANGDGVNGSPEIAHVGNYASTDGDYPGSTSTVYDPWISRDLKAGMNFGPSGFAPIPVGFGGSTYQTAYDSNGAFTGAWQFVGVYGGNVEFSTPEEISAYKTYRTQISGAVDGKSWSGTQMTFIGAPFAMTHGARATSTYVVGKSCTDCHSTTSNMINVFAGSVDMLGTAIKATAGNQFMQSPATQFTVVGAKDDIATGAEVTTKLGYSYELSFEQLCDWNSTTKSCTPDANGAYKQVTPLDQSQVLYPVDTGQAGITLPYVYQDVTGASYANRAAWINYITDPAAVNAVANKVAP